MKTLLTFAMLSMVIVANAQEQTKIEKYVSASVSLANGNSNAPRIDSISRAAYFMVEGGVSFKNVSVGLGFGRSSFNFSQKDSWSNWFVEPKTSVILLERGIAKGYGVFGIGSYLESNPRFFIEYGAGTVISLKELDLSVQYSVWDNLGYISFGVSKTF